MSGNADARRQWVLRVLDVDPGLVEAPGKPSPAAAARHFVQLWVAAKEQADVGLGRLQRALQGTRDPMFLLIADRGLSAVSGKLQVGLRVGLEEFARAPDPAGPAAAKLAKSVNEFLSFVEQDRAVALCDDNPFDVDVGLAATLGGALRQIKTELGRLRG